LSVPDATAPERSSPDALMLFGFWYGALRGAELKRGKLAQCTLLEIPLVLGRDAEGHAFAMRDACPHRSMPLSRGWFDGQLVECSYHGWKFDPHSGQCREIPSLTTDSKLRVDRIYANSFRCQEHDGYVWVFIPDNAMRGREAEPPAEAPRVPTFGGKYRMAHLSADLPCSVDHGIIGLMDPAHGPFVHQAWWWRSRHSIHEKQKAFEPIANGFRMSAHTPSANSAPYKLLRLYAKADAITTTIDFVLPNLRYEQIRAGKYWFSSLTTVTPITRDRCRIDFTAAWNLFRWVPLVVPLLKFIGAKFIGQDQRTMQVQQEGLRHSPHLMLIDDADRPAKWYFQLKAAHLDARRSGSPMRHPMSGPVVLRWRS
jgi:phenylpropionate dioxygenase-like ring-hydroxylating dioxygenase large terminal subunit